MKVDLYSTVDKFLNQYVGGTNFYDALDEEIRINDAWLHAMIQKVLSNEVFDGFIVSGKFGHRFVDFYLKNYQPTKEVLVANGALRKGNEIGIENKDLEGKKYILVPFGPGIIEATGTIHGVVFRQCIITAVVIGNLRLNRYQVIFEMKSILGHVRC